MLDLQLSQIAVSGGSLITPALLPGPVVDRDRFHRLTREQRVPAAPISWPRVLARFAAISARRFGSILAMPLRSTTTVTLSRCSA